MSRPECIPMTTAFQLEMCQDMAIQTGCFLKIVFNPFQTLEGLRSDKPGYWIVECGLYKARATELTEALRQLIAARRKFTSKSPKEE